MALKLARSNNALTNLAMLHTLLPQNHPLNDANSINVARYTAKSRY